MQTITAEEAIKIIVDEKSIRNTIINETLLLDQRVKGKSIVMQNVNIRGYLNICTTIKHLQILNTNVAEFVCLESAKIEGTIDLRETTFKTLHAYGAIAIAAHMSIQSKIVTSPSKLFPSV